MELGCEFDYIRITPGQTAPDGRYRLRGMREMAGHASVDTTARYDRRPEAERRKAVEALHYPYTKD